MVLQATEYSSVNNRLKVNFWYQLLRQVKCQSRLLFGVFVFFFMIQTPII